MSSSLLLMEPVGGSFRGFFPAWRTAWCEKTFCTMGVTRGSGVLPRVWLPVALSSQVLVGLASRASCLTTGVSCHAVSLTRDGWSLSFPPGELGAWACVALVVSHRPSRGWPPQSQGILTLVQALSLLLGLSSADHEVAPSTKPEFATQHFLPSVSLFPGGGPAFVARFLTVVSRWLRAIHDNLRLP